MRPPFLGKTPIHGKSLKAKFHSKFKMVLKKHSLGGHGAGYETHPDISRYDKEVISMWNEMTLTKERE